MATRAVPIWEELGGEGDVDVVVLGNSSKNVSSHPKVVTDGDTLAWSDLELPLSWHNLGVGTGAVDSGGEAGSVVLVGDDSTEAGVGTD